jgi:YHS domain-containing protein
MLRLLLFLILAVVVARAFWRMFDGIVEAVSGAPPDARASDRSVAMVRDPVCGTFVLPERAVALVDRGERLHFCSERCRDSYLAKTRQPAGVNGRAG